jgi:hypothetical protein
VTTESNDTDLGGPAPHGEQPAHRAAAPTSTEVAPSETGREARPGGRPTGLPEDPSEDRSEDPLFRVLRAEIESREARAYASGWRDALAALTAASAPADHPAR